MPTISPHLSRKVTGTFTVFTVRAQVNKHEPELVLYIIDSGRYFYVSETRTGIGGTVSRHKTLALAEQKATAIVQKRFDAGVKAAKKRVTLYG